MISPEGRELKGTKQSVNPTIDCYTPLHIFSSFLFMDVIFHEQQEGSLCAQHCLNALLQGEYFSAVDLAEIAQQLDESEREQMAVNGLQTEEYRKFMQQRSSNFDDSGFFSIQVIEKGLSVWGLHLVPFNSQNELAQRARQNPVEMNAYICNFRDHWLAIRKLGHQWFNLNSLLTGPELISDTFLSMFLAQLQQEGYSVFVVMGVMPECEADMLLKVMPVTQPIKPKLLRDDSPSENSKSSKSTRDSGKSGLSTVNNPPPDDREVVQPSQEEVRAKRLAFLSKVDSSNQSQSTGCDDKTADSAKGEATHTEEQQDVEDEDTMLQKAIAMSMENT